MGDVIQRLRELRQSSQSSVVTGIEEKPSDARPSIEHRLQSWLVDLILEELTSPRGSTLSLIVLSGNSGDGKSYLIREVQERLREDAHLDPSMVRWLLDATESRAQSERSEERLADFFASFRDSADWRPSQLHVVAMNTGTAVRFIDYVEASETNTYRTFCDILRLQLAIRGEPEHADDPAYWDRFDRVLVVDLDRRTLVPLSAHKESFLDQMLSTLDQRKPTNFLATASTACATCPSAMRCPVHTNLVALRHPRVRQRLNTLLRDITLEDRIHIGPRNLWHLVYQMTIGGLDEAAMDTAAPLPTCDAIPALDDETCARSLFFTAIFDVGRGTDVGAPALFAELLRIDPANRFTLDNHDLALSAALSSEEDLRLCTPLAAELGLAAENLHAPAKEPADRAKAAVRRAFFIQEAEPDAERHEGLRVWSNYLETYGRDILENASTRHETVHLLIDVLAEIYRGADLDKLWRLKLPWNSRVNLYTELAPKAGRKQLPKDPRVWGPDAYRAGGLRPTAKALGASLDAYPLSITVPIREGPDVRITWPLFRQLQRVKQHRYLAASLDPERVQNLERIGASLGAQSAKSGVAVIMNGRARVCEDDGNGGYDVAER